jgi:predicted phage baseplate assembly protein
MRWPLETPLPSISLRDATGADWGPKADLLASGERARDFVVEVETDGTAYLRFGDDHFGARPRAGARLTATYRVGNGPGGNVGRETLAHIVSKDSALASGVIERIWNPIGAAGGTDPESLEEIRQRAPSAFRIQERAVTPADYEDVVAKSHLGVQRAAATFRWTGSWRTVFVTADRLAGAAIDAAFAEDLRTRVEPFRMAGFDLEIDAPRFVSLEIEMTICVNPAYFAGHVEQALLDVFSNRLLADGTKGAFHPDNFSFGDNVYLSPMIAAAQSVAGVDAVRVVKFQRQGQPDVKGLDSGKLTFGRLEIARLDNDPNFPERGVFTLTMEGGR